MTQSPVVRSFIFDSSAMIYQDDKTMAIIRHDPMEQVADCMLYDLEWVKYILNDHISNDLIMMMTTKLVTGVIDMHLPHIRLYLDWIPQYSLQLLKRWCPS